MSRHIIFLVHGVGTHDPKTWSDTVQAQLRATYSAYGIAKALPFDDCFEFKPITYDDRLEKIRTRWKTDAEDVLAKLADGGLNAPAVKALANVAAAPADDGPLGTAAMDVVLYRFFPTVAEAIRTEVVDAILSSVFDEEAGESREWSIVAHSLGTAVTHDALHALYTSTVHGQAFAGLSKARVVMMLANVSRLLEEKKVDVYRSTCRPGAAATDGVCRYFINAIHDWDPIPKPREFRPVDDWPSIQARMEGRFVPVRINAFQHKNIHAFTHYLANPKVHVPFFRHLFKFGLPEQVINAKEYDNAVALFESQTPFGTFEALQQKLKPLQLGEAASWKDLINAFSRFAAAVKGF